MTAYLVVLAVAAIGFTFWENQHHSHHQTTGSERRWIIACAAAAGALFLQASMIAYFWSHAQ